MLNILDHQEVIAKHYITNTIGILSYQIKKERSISDCINTMFMVNWLFEFGCLSG